MTVAVSLSGAKSVGVRSVAASVIHGQIVVKRIVAGAALHYSTKEEIADIAQIVVVKTGTGTENNSH